MTEKKTVADLIEDRFGLPTQDGRFRAPGILVCAVRGAWSAVRPCG